MTQTLGQVRIASDRFGPRTTFEELEIGKDLGTEEFLVTQAQIDQVCDRLEDHHPYYEVNSPFGGTVAPVSMTYLITRALFSQTYSVRGLFYKWAVDCMQPVRPGVRHTVTGTLTNKWVKNEREFVAYESVCKDEKGNVIFTTQRAHVLDFIKRTAPKVAHGIGSSSARTPEGRAGRQPYWDPDWPADETAALTGDIVVPPLANFETPIGAPLPSVSIFMSKKRFIKLQEQHLVGRARNLHVDMEAAQQEGLPAPVASAPDLMAMAHRSALEFFGAGWLKGGRADLTCARPTYIGDYVTSKGVVTGRDRLPDGSQRLQCSVWVENQKGEKKVVGTVSGIVGAS
jgi:acyl dehydratase